MTAASWAWERRVGPAHLLHAPEPPAVHEPTVRILDVDAPTLVLGSSQPAADVDQGRAEARGIEVATRRSGGGAVWLAPGDQVWIDVWLPRGAAEWRDDVVRAVDWLADVWLDTLSAVGIADLTVHRGPMVHTRWSRQVCFAGLGPGEVCAGGRKLVGISQRRTREWARFQCVVHRRWDPSSTFGLLTDPEAAAASAMWREAVAVVGDADVVAEFSRVLRIR